MESPCSTPSSSRSRGVTNDSATSSRLPHHLLQPSSSNSGPAVHSTSEHSIRPGQPYVTVQTLNKENLVIVVNQKTRVHDILWKCGEILEITEDKLFGLALRQPTDGIGGDQPRHEYFFLDPAQKIFKYAPKQPRFSNWHNRSTENRPLLVLYFRVRVYIEQVRLITCSRALEHYYLQLKDNFLDQWSGRHSVSEGRCWEMASLALRADKGDNPGGYFRAEQYFPMWVIDFRGLEYVRKHMPTAFDDLKDLSKKDAMTQFCLEACRSPFALNCHLYALRRHKMDSVDNAVIGINAKGIEICDIGKEFERVPLRSLTWSRVTRLSFDRKKLTIVGADGTKMSLYAQSEHKAKYLLELCRAVHQTLLVFSHQTARNAPLPQPFLEKSVDRLSASSASGAVTNDNDSDSVVQDSMSSCDRGQGSVNSKHRIRVKLDSNLELKIEKMELESIRQERAASQSSKASESSEHRTSDITSFPTDDEVQFSIPSVEIIQLPSANSSASTTESTTTYRPSSVDSASQTVETGTRIGQVDFNFNNKLDHIEHDGFASSATFGNMVFMPEAQYASSAGSRSDSVQQSNEMLPDLMINSYHHHEKCSTTSDDDADTTLRSGNMTGASLSLSDLRSAGFKDTPSRYLEDPPDYRVQRAGSPGGKQRWTMACGTSCMTQSMNALGSSGQARSEPKIDSELWAPTTPVALLSSPGPSNGRLFTKRGNSGASRMAPSISRVHSMPAHYHIANGFVRNSQTDDYPQTTSLQHVQSLNGPRTQPKARDPPPYDRAAPHTLSVSAASVLTGNTSAGPLTAETPGGPQAAFPPASATPSMFCTNTEEQYFLDTGVLSANELQHFPMLQKLMRESNGMLNHQRRPSSCTDLSSMFSNSVHRGEFFPDSTVQSVPYGMTRMQNQNPNSYGFRPSSAVVLPPPPPYPSNRKALVM